jgi:hypothetical protein
MSMKPYQSKQSAEPIEQTEHIKKILFEQIQALKDLFESIGLTGRRLTESEKQVIRFAYVSSTEFASMLHDIRVSIVSNNPDMLHDAVNAVHDFMDIA